MRWSGLAVGPVLAGVVYLILPSGDLGPSDRATAAIGVLMAVWWMSEALPLAATALLPILLFPMAGVFPRGADLPSQIRQATAPYAHELIFLFLGGFLIALAVERWNLHRRIALLTVLAVGTQPARLVAGFMLATSFLSMWISNTASTVMMLPIGISVIRLVEDSVSERGDVDGCLEGGESGAGRSTTRNFSLCLMLGIAYAATIGGTGTLIGTPPNAILAGFLEDTYELELGFGRWMLVGVPLAGSFLFLTWIVLTRVVFPIRLRSIPGGRELIASELRKLGPMSRAEWTVLSVFIFTAILWIVREPLTSWSWLTSKVPSLADLEDPGVAILGALLLFAIPINARERVFALDWQTARRLPWGVLLLFGGGLSLASAVAKSDLPDWIGNQLPAHLPVLLLVFVATTVVVFLTELTSNMATATVLLPILSSVATGVGADPRLLAVPTALAASCAFMLPVATPPNAIVFGSERVTVAAMVKAGLLLNLLSILLVPTVVYVLGVWALGIEM